MRQQLSKMTYFATLCKVKILNDQVFNKVLQFGKMSYLATIRSFPKLELILLQHQSLLRQIEPV